MLDTFYCGGCGKWKPLGEKVERSGRRPKCRCCDQRARKLDSAAPRTTSGLRRPAVKMDEDFLRWVSHV